MNAYYISRRNPLDTSTEWLNVQITSSNTAKTATACWLSTNVIVAAIVEGTNLNSYRSIDFGYTWTKMATLKTDAYSGFIELDRWSGLIHLVWVSKTNGKIMYNVSRDWLSSLLYTTDKTVYDETVNDQQPSLIILNTGVLEVTFVDTSGTVKSRYSNDLGQTWLDVP